MDFEKINLLKAEKRSLFLFHFKKKRIERKIKYFHSLYHEYDFLQKNYSNEVDCFGSPVHDGTYSISDNYRRYKVFRRRKRLEILPNWIAITISFFSLIVSILALLLPLSQSCHCP